MCELEGIIKYKYMQKVTHTVAYYKKSQRSLKYLGNGEKEKMKK